MEFDRVPPIAKYLSVVFLLTRLGSSTVWFFLPLFFQSRIESVFLIGLMTSIPAALPVITDIPMGNLVQRAGEKIVIFSGLLINLLPGLFYLTGLPVMLVLGKAFEGIVKGMIWNGGWTLALKSADSENEGESNSVFLLGVNLAAIVGPVLGGYLIAAEGFELPFALWVLSAWLAALTFYLYIGLEGHGAFIDSIEELFHRRTYSDDWKHLKNHWDDLKKPVSLIFSMSIIYSFFWLAIPFLLEDVTGYQTMGLIIGFAALPKLFQFVFGDLGDKYGDLRVAGIMSVLLIPVLAVTSVVENVYLIAALFFTARMFVAGLSPVLHAYYDAQIPDEIEGEMTGFLEFFKHIGQAIGPAMAGAAASVGGISLSFQAAALVALGLSVMIFSFR